jgi:hypothetical protein
MKHQGVLTISTLAILLAFGASAQAELRHVELKTLGMD